MNSKPLLKHFYMQLIEVLKLALTMHAPAQKATRSMVSTLIGQTKNESNLVSHHVATSHHTIQEQTVQEQTTALVTQYFLQAAQHPKMPVHLQGLAASLIRLQPLLNWYQRPSHGTRYSPTFSQGHANAYIIGNLASGALVASQGIAVGLTLMAPSVTYVDHQHPPEELYIILSPGQWRQVQDDWYTPKLGGYVYNPPNIIHAMRAGTEPLLALWCLNLN